MRGSLAMMGLTALLTLVGCGSTMTYTLKGSPRSPELDAKIVAEVRKQAYMTTLKISAEHLAPPSRIGSGGTYVAWFKNEKGDWTRIGALSYDEGDRKGGLEGASVPLTTFDLAITVESSAGAKDRSSDVLFTQHVN